MIAVARGYHIEVMRCELCLIVGKVLIFFKVQLNNSLIIPIKSAQCEGITLIKTLIKNITLQLPINYFEVSKGNDLNSVLRFPCFWQTRATNQRST